MGKENNGGPAFARAGSQHDNSKSTPFQTPQEGMSLRDYFAAKAMQVLIEKEGRGQSLAFESYSIADQMIQQRNR